MSGDFYPRPPAHPRPKIRGRSLADRNRRLIAERLDWEAGAVEECERMEREFPGFDVAWFAESVSEDPAFNRPAGFYAWRTGDQPGQMWSDGWHGRQEWYGVTIDNLRAQLASLG